MFKLVLLYLAIASCQADVDFQPFIVGGQNASLGQFPYMVSFQDRGVRGTHMCGGGILNQRWILTAAHCIVPDEVLPLVVAVTGTIDLETGGAEYGLERTVTHPAYRPIQPPVWTSTWNDIALVKTDSNIIFNEVTQPIPIRRKIIFANSPATVAGFGAFFTNITTESPREDLVMSRYLQFLDTRTISYNECNFRALWHRLMNPDAVIRPVLNPLFDICTLQPNGHGTCFGDSGSMLISNGEVIGIVVSGIAPCGRGQPDIYVRVFSFIPWIENYIQEI